jgi:hypothetical protein
MYKLAMVTAQHDAKSDDASTRAQAKTSVLIAQSARKSAIDRANATARAALAALNNK